MQPYYQDRHTGITIYHADYREVLPALLGDFDLVLTDPPYGIGATRMNLGNGRKKVYRGELDWDAAPADLQPLLALGVPSIIWGGNYFPLPLSRGWLVWDKGTGDNDYGDCELAWTNRDAVIKRYAHSWVGMNAKERQNATRYHPTQKPVALMRWCLQMFPDAPIVFDPFMGSGSTLCAAKDLLRPAIGIEIEERYCEIAAGRLAQGVLSLFV